MEKAQRFLYIVWKNGNIIYIIHNGSADFLLFFVSYTDDINIFSGTIYEPLIKRN